MKIQKFLHSCILIENAGKRLLIDPGAFSFIEKQITPKDIGPVDCILLTHKHLDHYFPEAIEEFCAMRPDIHTPIIANEEICALIKQQHLSADIIREGETRIVEGFKIHALKAPHEPIPAECPHNLAFVINDKLLHPGDSLHTSAECDLLFLPIAGPWCRLIDAIEFAEKIKPKKIIPIHDAIIKDFMIERMYQLCENKVKSFASFHPLKLGEHFEN